MKKISLIILHGLFFGNALFAQDILKITSIEEANQQINNFIHIFEDTTNSLDISQILVKKAQDLLVPINNYNKKISSKNTYWLYFSMDNSSVKDLQVGLVIPREDHLVDIYTIAGSILFVQKSGFFMDAEQNSEIIPYSNIIQVKNTDRADFYLKIKNINDELPGFSIKVANIDEEVRKITRKTTFDGIINGMLWLMIIYGLFLFFMIKDKTYLYYSLYVFFIAIWYFCALGLGYRLFPELPREIFPYTDLSNILGWIFYIQFIRFFINTSQTLPRWDKILKIAQILLSIECVGIPVFILLTNLVIVNYIIENIVGFVTMILCTGLIIRLFHEKTKLTYIILIGSSFLLLGQLLGSVLFIFYNDTEFLSNKLGFLTELLVFAFGISFRYTLIEADKQKFQKQLIIQLNENAELQGKVNRELSEKVKEATAEIVSRNKEITDSIHYASLIQTAVLPPLDFITEWGIENFILYKPKAVVSGDFYWGKKRNEKIILAAGDCTGHGVPGAFMSMLGHAFLDEIINTTESDNAAEVLNRLRDEVITTLKQKGKTGETKDGMDMALCIIDMKAGQLEYSGANNPLYLIRGNNLIKVEADKMPIGIHFTSLNSFTNKTIEIRKGDCLYLFSDGFADQFGGPYGKKFMYKSFQDLIIQNHISPMEQQKEILEKTFEKWKGEREQIDDVMVLGLRM